jgi:hypothetical protein
MDRQIGVKGWCCALTLLMVAGCTKNLHHNEGALQIAHSADGSQIASIYLPYKGQGSIPQDRPIEKGEAFSIKLVSAYICDFRESTGPTDWFSRSNARATPCAGGDGNFNFIGSANYTRGEIAIIANAGERNDTTAGLTFDPSDVQRHGRVVYYNEDIRESGQLINALNIPVYGPKTYDGGPFFMDWAVLELDNDESEQSRQLLQELANVGSAAYAPGTPVLNLLNTLGGALLSANGDDVELRYQLEFDPPYTGMTKADSRTISNRLTSYAPLREGYYALVRMEHRDQLPPFDLLKVTDGKYNPMLGISVPAEELKPGTAAARRLYKDSSWLLIRVSREDHKQALTHDLSAKTAEFLKTLSGKKDLTESERQQWADAFKFLLKDKLNDEGKKKAK